MKEQDVQVGKLGVSGIQKSLSFLLVFTVRCVLKVAIRFSSLSPPFKQVVGKYGK